MSCVEPRNRLAFSFCRCLALSRQEGEKQSTSPPMSRNTSRSNADVRTRAPGNVALAAADTVRDIDANEQKRSVCPPDPEIKPAVLNEDDVTMAHEDGSTVESSRTEAREDPFGHRQKPDEPFEDALGSEAAVRALVSGRGDANVPHRSGPGAPASGTVVEVRRSLPAF